MRFGLIGYPLGHSFSKAYFTGKFHLLGLDHFFYENYSLEHLDEVRKVLNSDVFGLNVTIPYKTAILEYLTEIEPAAFQIGAVNTLVRTGSKNWKGFNTDAVAFETSLLEWFKGVKLPGKALILGSGGSSKAVSYTLKNLGIEVSVVSRSGKGEYGYNSLSAKVMQENRLIINTTPVGMDPDIESCPAIPYNEITSAHWLYDLVYNPGNTLFLMRGQQCGARTKNGFDMLRYQAEAAWLIWKSYGKF